MNIKYFNIAKDVFKLSDFKRIKIGWCIVLNHEVIAITDHVDWYNVDNIPSIQDAIDDINANWDITVVLGAEVTHAPVESIDGIAKRAKQLGAKIVVVHGETLNAPVTPGTNRAAVESKYVDIIGHPGLITKEEAEIALKNDIYLEISARKGHCLGNGHVANIARAVWNKLLVDTDTHAPGDIITFDKSYEVALGAGLSHDEAMKAIVDNPRELLKSKGILWRHPNF